MNILQSRLASQQISRHGFQKPEDLVYFLGAMQAQDYAMAKWAIGCRLRGITDAQVEMDFNEGRIIRTHVLRPTWHFVSPKDVRWMLTLTGAKIKSFAKPHHAKLEIDSAVIKRSRKILEKMLKHGPMARNSIQEGLEHAGINTNDSRLSFLLMEAELDGLICSAGRKGKQFAYGLLDALVPKYKTFDGREAVVELARRYFTGHGPATVSDFAWWSGLPLSQIRQAMSFLKNELISERFQEQEYWFHTSEAYPSSVKGRSYFLPAFDEYYIGYANRHLLADPVNTKKLLTNNGIFNPMLIQKGRVTGTWKRTEAKSGLQIRLSPFSDSQYASDAALFSAAKKYYRFLGTKGTIIPA